MLTKTSLKKGFRYFLGGVSAIAGIVLTRMYIFSGFAIEGLTQLEVVNQTVWVLVYFLLSAYCFRPKRKILIGTGLVFCLAIATPSCSHVSFNEHNRDEIARSKQDPTYKPKMARHAHYVWEAISHIH